MTHNEFTQKCLDIMTNHSNRTEIDYKASAVEFIELYNENMSPENYMTLQSVAAAMWSPVTIVS